MYVDFLNSRLILLMISRFLVISIGYSFHHLEWELWCQKTPHFISDLIIMVITSFVWLQHMIMVITSTPWVDPQSWVCKCLIMYTCLSVQLCIQSINDKKIYTYMNPFIITHIIWK